LAFSTVSVHALLEAWQSADAATWAAVLLFGIGWGGGSVTFGLGVGIVGNSLGFSLILGLCATLGSVIPLLVLHTSEAGTKTGVFDFIALGITLVGLVLVGYAGTLKTSEQIVSAAGAVSKSKQLKHEHANERVGFLGGHEDEHDQLLSVNGASAVPVVAGGGPASGAPAPASGPSFLVGILLCVASGVLSAMLNLSLSFGHPIQDRAQEEGASKHNAPNAVWVLGLGGGFLTNIGYTLYLVAMDGSWGLFCKGCVRGCAGDKGEGDGNGGGGKAALLPTGTSAASASDTPTPTPLAWYEAEAGSVKAWAYAIVSGAAWFFGTSIYGSG